MIRMPSMWTQRAVLTAFVLTPLVVAAACSKKKPPTDPSVAPADAGWGTPTTTADAGAPPADAAVPDAAPTADAAAQPIDPMTQQSLEAAIDKRAKEKDAKNMKAVGAVFGGTLAQGGELESPPIQIEVNKCYTVVAQGGPGVTELDIRLMATTPLPGINPVLAVDNTSGPEAAITPCWKNATPFAGPGKIVLAARGGSGAVAGKLFVK